MNEKYRSLKLAVKLQALMCLFLSGAMVIISYKAVFSTLVGCGISILVSILMIMILKPKPGVSAEVFMGKLVLAESVKFLTITLLMVIALTLLNTQPQFLLAGFIFSLVVYWIIIAFTLKS